MGNENVDDVFNDFEQKVEGKHEAFENPKKEMDEDELLKKSIRNKNWP